jgi:hypothetical protein
MDWNLYQYKRVPFGLAIGAQVLTRLLDMIFHYIKSQCVYHYLDDLVVYYEEHLQQLNEVFSRLRSGGLTVNPSKVMFAVQEINFLGHRVSSAGIAIDPERTRAIVDFPPPRDVKGIARFIGMVNFYHKFISKMADIAAPLNSLRNKGVKFEWRQSQQETFDQVKQPMSQQPVLCTADFSKPFVLQTDARGQALLGFEPLSSPKLI